MQQAATTTTCITWQPTVCKGALCFEPNAAQISEAAAATAAAGQRQQQSTVLAVERAVTAGVVSRPVVKSSRLICELLIKVTAK